MSIGDAPTEENTPFAANGPTSQSLRVGFRTSQTWSVGLSPVGWARYANGPASAIANSIVDASTHPAFKIFTAIPEIIAATPDDADAVVRQIDTFLCQIDSPRSPHEEKVIAMHEALRDPSVGDVETLSERVGISRRTLERLASRFFGFPPKTLLRRQRFLRSLGKFTIEPGRSWSASLDGHYVDQAHFVREFRAFMEMTPSEYAQMPHPVLGNIFTKRLTEQGAH
ncbi:helix-turn-helix domain-containing protein [Aurantiacibacter rhizosphaerae]|uniref:Helix-turn-helix domain-containing protein n=1 Tax=Aurantiacibacter rhizosphaerae TaxID=2691582 RepID=A0A844XDV6_9SPHN|nr:helix-turn-helix domain-containing protein [Aurantiacibacter rhizosphaerae]